MIERRYRQDYVGEFVVVNTDIRRGIKEQQREWIPNPASDIKLTNYAAVIGSSIDQPQFDIGLIIRHHGGFAGNKKLRTYGTGDIWNKHRLDIYCGTDRRNLDLLQQTNYHAMTPIYTNARFCMMFPGKFFMIPYQPPINELAAAVYMAAFDGNANIYLVGYSNDTPGNTLRWKQDVADVLSAYYTHQFYLVGGPSNMPDIWCELDNVECMTYKQFRLSVDI